MIGLALIACFIVGFVAGREAGYNRSLYEFRRIIREEKEKEGSDEDNS